MLANRIPNNYHVFFYVNRRDTGHLRYVFYILNIFYRLWNQFASAKTKTKEKKNRMISSMILSAYISTLFKFPNKNISTAMRAAQSENNVKSTSTNWNMGPILISGRCTNHARVETKSYIWRTSDRNVGVHKGWPTSGLLVAVSNEKTIKTDMVQNLKCPMLQYKMTIKQTDCWPVNTWGAPWAKPSRQSLVSCAVFQLRTTTGLSHLSSKFSIFMNLPFTFDGSKEHGYL